MNVILTLLFGPNRRFGMGCTLVTFLCIVVIIGGIAIAAFVSLKQDQDAALKQYGEAVLNLCNNLNPGAPDQGDLAGGASAKLTYMTADVKTIRTSYVTALPADRQAKDKTDLTGVVCLNESSTGFATDQYKDTSGVVKYTCPRYQKVLDAYLFDTKSGKLVAYKQFTGPTPPECPDTSSSNTSRTGDSPDAAEVTSWAISPTSAS